MLCELTKKKLNSEKKIYGEKLMKTKFKPTETLFLSNQQHISVTSILIGRFSCLRIFLV